MLTVSQLVQGDVYDCEIRLILNLAEGFRGYVQAVQQEGQLGCLLTFDLTGKLVLSQRQRLYCVAVCNTHSLI